MAKLRELETRRPGHQHKGFPTEKSGFELCSGLYRTRYLDKVSMRGLFSTLPLLAFGPLDTVHKNKRSDKRFS